MEQPVINCKHILSNIIVAHVFAAYAALDNKLVFCFKLDSQLQLVMQCLDIRVRRYNAACFWIGHLSPWAEILPKVFCNVSHERCLCNEKVIFIYYLFYVTL